MNNNTNNQNNNQSTSLALNLSGNIIGKIMTPADFTALDSLIQKLGDKSANLAPDEKTAAMSVVDEWNESVTSRIQYNAEQAKLVLDFLDSKQMYGDRAEEIIELFRSVIGDTDEYAAVRMAADDYAQVQNNFPVETPVDDAMTVAEADRVVLENRAARVAYDRAVRSAELRYCKAVKAYINAVNGLPEIKNVRARLQDYKRKANRMVADCKDKAAKAKLNISISDAETRALLHEMLDFTKTV